MLILHKGKFVELRRIVVDFLGLDFCFKSQLYVSFLRVVQEAFTSKDWVNGGCELAQRKRSGWGVWGGNSARCSCGLYAALHEVLVEAAWTGPGATKLLIELCEGEASTLGPDLLLNTLEAYAVEPGGEPTAHQELPGAGEWSANPLGYQAARGFPVVSAYRFDHPLQGCAVVSVVFVVHINQPIFVGLSSFVRDYSFGIMLLIVVFRGFSFYRLDGYLTVSLQLGC